MMLAKPQHCLFAGLGFLALAAAPLAHAVGPPATFSTASSADTQMGFAFSSDSVEVYQNGVVMVLAGHVRLDIPASSAVGYSSESITVQPDGAQVFEGAVELTIEQSHVATERAVITRSADGGSVISMDRADICRAFGAGLSHKRDPCTCVVERCLVARTPK